MNINKYINNYKQIRIGKYRNINRIVVINIIVIVMIIIIIINENIHIINKN